MKLLNKTKETEIFNSYTGLNFEIFFNNPEECNLEKVVVCYSNLLGSFGCIDNTLLEKNLLIIPYINVFLILFRKFKFYQIGFTGSNKLKLWEFETENEFLNIICGCLLELNSVNSKRDLLIPELNILIWIGFDLKVVMYNHGSSQSFSEILMYFKDLGLDVCKLD